MGVIRHFLILLLAISISGGHYVCFQLLAWTEMVANRANMTTPVEQSADFFDGGSRCQRCIAVHQVAGEEKTGDQDDIATVSATKIDALLVIQSRVFCPLAPSWGHLWGLGFWFEKSFLEPELPPPRQLLG